MTRAAALTALAIVLAASGARAEEARKSDPVARRIFAAQVDAKKPMACFARAYDSAHLAAHPRQKVAAMMALFTEDKDAEEGGAALGFRVGFKMRGAGAKFDNAGNCGHADVTETGASSASIHCYIDCDGGGLDVQISADNKSLRVGLEGFAVYPAGSKRDDDNVRALETGADDKVFRLDRVSLADCLPLAQGKAEIALMSRAK
jgi:hypothetical protein